MFKMFIERPKFAIVIALLISLIGAISAANSPIGRYPDVAPVTVEVRTFMDGASANVMAKSVAPEIEKQVNGVSGMEYMKSTSGADGTYTLEVVFESGTDSDKAVNLVQNRVNLALPELPGDVMRNGVKVEKLSNGLMLGISITDPSGGASAIDISAFSGGPLKEKIQRVNGVSKVDVLGEKKYSIRVWLNPDKMKYYSINVGDINDAIATQNKIASAGSLVDDKLEFPITVNGGLATPEEFGDIVVRSDELGKTIYLKDVANIELGSEIYTANAYGENANGTVLFIYKTPEANAMNVAKEIKALLEQPNPYQIKVVYDATTFIDGAIYSVLETLVLAVAIVSLVTLIFMQNFRLTLITVTAIPVSLIGTFAVMSALGIQVNIISMFGLVMAIGIVVDAAIIVIENAEHQLHENPELSVKQAVSKALDITFSPIIASMLVLLAVFTPSLFIPGMAGTIYSEFGIVLCASVVVSTLVALTLTPALCSLFMKPPKKNIIAKSVEWVITQKIRAFAGLAWTATRLPLITILLLAGGLYLSIDRGVNLPTGLLPEEDTSAIFVVGSFPQGTALAATDQYLATLTQQLNKIPGISTSVEASGFNLLTNTAEMSSFMMLLSLDDMLSRQASDAELTEQINHVLSENTDIQAFAFKPPVIPELGMVDGVNFVLLAPELSPVELYELTLEFNSRLMEDERVGLAMGQFEVTKPSMKLNIKRQDLLKYGATFAEVVEGMQTHFGGMYINTFNMDGRNYKVMVQNDPKFRLDPEALKKTGLSKANGTRITYDKFFDFEEIKVPNFITRYNAEQGVFIDVIPAVSTGQAISAIQELADELGYRVEFTGAAKEEVSAGNTVAIVMGLAMLVTFLVLVAQYESWLIPLAIMLTVPTAIIGIVEGVIHIQGNINILTQLAAILLIGMTVRNAILIVEFAKTLRDDNNFTIKEAAVQALRLRARAVFMTAFSFGVGLVPLMLANAVGSGGQQALGWASFGGIVSATFIGCIMASVFFVVIQQIREHFKSIPA
ncbi:efflux RND transporter permease subunit [Vibrio mediterranei]|uniref:Efflux RND transporter permease subunit n=1 Tax=Vibrio mediterranei TaxID=689 RepID=A0A3G4VGN8_9VIBR|nr:efflux RND transporter permease subunit [Vibrio mediterranei]AYV23997.1 efflux RND transporter permease subunit [Vibrio mediterranei]NUW74228.1 efflux RND transporter permease subunit [Vibrio mediterranei]